MPINPKYIASHVVPGLGAPEVESNVIELFLDYNCPFACKLFKKVQDEIIPKLKEQGLEKKYQLVFVNVIQPWHGFQSAALHEIGLAVAKVEPAKFWKASRVLYDNIESFYDSEVYDLSRRELVERIAGLVAGELGLDKDQLVKLVQTPGRKDGKPFNEGNQVTKDVKYFTRYARTRGIHTTPSVALNGIYLANIESSTSSDEIIEVLEAQTK